MLEKTRRILMCSILSLSMISNFVSPVFAEEEDSEEEIVEMEDTEKQQWMKL